MADQKSFSTWATSKKLLNWGVINFSQRPLSSLELSVLSAGIRFIPTQGLPVSSMKKCFKQLLRTMKIRCCVPTFSKKCGGRSRHGVCTPPSVFNPDLYKPFWLPSPSIALFKRQSLQLFKEFEASVSRYWGSSSFPLNLPADERFALSQLCRDPSRCVVPADKDQAFCVLDTSHYLDLAKKHLSDLSTYCPLCPFPQSDHWVDAVPARYLASQFSLRLSSIIP